MSVYEASVYMDAAATDAGYGEQCAPASIAALSRSWLDEVRDSVKESTYALYQYTLAKYILPHWGSQLIEAVDGESVNVFLAGLVSGSAGGRPLAVKTVRRIMIILRAMFKFAIAIYHSFFLCLRYLLVQSEMERLL